ncbi:Asp-tRNA(Asn)/Glu-tRNA(Gln) amidotransferase subunit GatB [Fenollaria sp.]|uniref:Asp-tRNA(Asn)/Glu-tRNA(Gln) amidotransferase subunit GatB n=1 Tax=Fenollaria sp. TaxID=1965292 RepID=UPI002A75269E|nr:Asp-tRNA(Asn)/Glu-tRNA(Gln) amidotransferase subunit GatB [Fenollaria sp.]MDY3105676.1 Asp-tRNA(Asn)/Glu-tRNA(Gln) amidotransferase subunit GatB [Fenollaria sp.]
MAYKTIIGLEIHVELKTKTKMFCHCKNEFGEEANTNVCPICLGLPGTLPQVNEEAINYAIKAGLAMNCKIHQHTRFDRKSYFYADLVKGYQITQDELPLCYEGYVNIEDEDGNDKKIRLIRIHVEEDTGKSLHTDKGETLLDYNRCGVPLIEIVTYPDMNSAKEAREFLEKLKATVIYLGVSDGKMEEGSLRCDVNVNVVDTETGIKTNISEIKNIGSFRGVEKAIDFEVSRHIALLEKGENTKKETRRWDELKGESILMREKIKANDYRYAPDGDIPPMDISDEMIDAVRKEMPELPDEKVSRLMKDYGISKDDAKTLSLDVSLANYYEELAKKVDDNALALNWLLGDVLRRLKEDNKSIDQMPFAIEDLEKLLTLVKTNKINNNAGKKVLQEMFKAPEDPEAIVKRLGLVQVTDEGAIEAVVDKVLEANPQSIEDFKNGKSRAFGFLVGQVMKEMKGKGNPQIINELLNKKLN